MSERLTREGEDQLRVLAKSIGLSHELGPEIQEELFGHLEDQALAYLSGEETITEEDAIVLTREHFGDARALKEWLGSVHAPAASVAMYRRLAAIATVTLVAGAIVRTIGATTYHAAARTGWMWLQTVVAYRLHSLGAIAALLTVLWLLTRWRRQERQGKTVWYERGAAAWGALTIAVISVIASEYLVDSFSVVVSEQFKDGARIIVLERFGDSVLGLSGFPKTVFPLQFEIFLAIATSFFWPIVWIWWSDEPPRRWRAMLQGLGAFFLVGISLNLYLHALHSFGVLAHSSVPFYFGDWVLNTFASVLRSQMGAVIVIPVALILYAIARVMHSSTRRWFPRTQ